MWTARLLLPVFLSAASAQTANLPAQQHPATAASKDSKPPRGSDRKRAIKLYLQASKLFDKQQFEAAMADYQKAADLDPTNANYALAANVARSHAVTALIQASTRDRLTGDAAGSRAALAHALELDPKI